MTETSESDLRGVSFDEFVTFIFERSVSVPTQKEKWYWNVDVHYVPEEIATHYVQLFIEPSFLLSRYLRPELEQGFWAIQSANLGCAVPNIIWHDDLPLETREICVRSMFHLFERLFAFEHLETSAHMWWDSLCYDWHCGNRSRSKDEDRLMQDVMFETLGKILCLPSLQCQGDALHGLGHLQHPDTEKLIRGYLDQNPSLDPEMQWYALSAAQFRIL